METNNKPHTFSLMLRMDDKIIASRMVYVTEYNDNVIYSLRLNELMKDMGKLIEEALKDNSITEAHRLISKGVF